MMARLLAPVIAMAAPSLAWSQMAELRPTIPAMEAPLRSTTVQRDASTLAKDLKDQIVRCWRPPPRPAGSVQMIVDVEMRLKPDGKLVSPPKAARPASTPAQQAALDAAMVAIVKCAPYNLPKHLYKGGWDHVIVSFDPTSMY